MHLTFCTAQTLCFSSQILYQFHNSCSRYNIFQWHKTILEVSLRVGGEFFHASEVRDIVGKKGQMDLLLKWWLVILPSAVSHLPVLVHSFLLTLSLSLLLDIFLIMPDAQICSFFSLHMLLLHCPFSLWFRIIVLLKGCWQSWCFWRVDSRKGHLHVVSDQSLISSLSKLPVFCVWMIHKLQTRPYYKLGQTVNSLWLKLQPKSSLNPVSCVSLQQLAVFCKVWANSLWLEAGNACPLLCLTWLFWIQSL